MANQILVVEDEEGLSTLLKTELSFEHYDVLIAKDGESAMQQFNEHQDTLSVILLDWMIPKMDGLEVLRRVRRQAKKLPIIFLTARDYLGDKVAGLDSGADDYITKPFAMEELLARLRVIFRHEEQQSIIDPIYYVSDLELNTKTHQVTRGNTHFQLTQREYALLLFLMQNKGQTFTRNEILDKIWGTDFVGQTNIVDVYIRLLRNKIDRDFSKKLIHTIRGVGYCLKKMD